MKKKAVKCKAKHGKSSSVIIANGQDTALSILSVLAIHNKVPCAYFSNGVSKDELVQKMLCKFSGVEESKFKKGNIKTKNWPSLLNAGDLLSNAPLYIDDSVISTSDDLQTKVKGFLNTHKNGICVVDNAESLFGK